jgi:hypothetical protein
VDPHPIHLAIDQPLAFAMNDANGNADNADNDADNVDDWDHWAMPQGNNANGLAQGNAAALKLMDVDNASQGVQAKLPDVHSSLTLTFSFHDSVVNSGEVNQPIADFQADNIEDFLEPEVLPGPVIVHGNIPALHMDNFL